MADDDAPSDSSLLVIIVDTNPNQRYITEDPKVLTSCLDAVIAFANSHLMQKARNELAVIGCHFHKRLVNLIKSQPPEEKPGESLLAGAVAMALCFIAKKQQVLIDVCSLDKHLSLLQQGCDITGGLYLKVPSLEGLLQYLLWVFLPETSERTKLVLPGRGRVDYRAACFCHRELLTIGYVCSVCLSGSKKKYRIQDWRPTANKTEEEENESLNI
ncbi:hypothetical protein HF086_010618 [Spodoptera exigua]|uniref:General transcription factor IIH subunit 3 n=1 Tax=Spodoptera exigua TaxID=7107 RepID=A0A922MUM1_SPOEX|nr:hypothetical protein HF086_010618 [Spodoptera exigua]